MCLPKPPRKSDCKRCFRHNHFRRLYAKVLISSLSLLGGQEGVGEADQPFYKVGVGHCDLSACFISEIGPKLTVL